MTDKENTIKELKEALDSLDIINKYRLNLIRAIEYLQEQPISEKKCMFTKDNYIDENRKILCEDCKEKCEYSKKEESVSEDLEKAANEWDAKASFNPFYMALDSYSNPYEVKQDYTTHAKSFKAGAQWQKEKDDEEKVLIYKHGFEDCKEQIMTNAIDSHCFGFQGAALFSFRLPADKYLVGSKVKIFVIKED